MATNFKQTRRKLYFDVTLNKGQTNAVVCCTQFSNGTPGDRYGGLLDDMPALTGSSPASNKVRAAVQAWFVPQLLFYSSATGLGTSTSPQVQFDVNFCQPTANGANKSVKLLPYLTVGTLAPLNNLSGHEAIYSITNAGAARHFGVRVRRRGSGVASISVCGTLYVARQHSLEV